MGASLRALRFLTGALGIIVLGACWTELRLGDGEAASGAGGSTASSTTSGVATGSATTAAIASVATGTGGGGGEAPFVCDPPAEPNHLYAFSAESLDISILEPVSMCQYRGELLLIVNTASKCVYTPQYAPLEDLASNPTLAANGFRVLGFISDDFHAAAGTTEEIDACNAQYAVTFDQFSQIVVDPYGDPPRPSPLPVHPIFEWLTTQPGFEGPVTFNFNKFLVSRDGVLLGRWDETVEPDDPEIIAAIELNL